MAELRAHFRPEFLNRVDDTVLFTPLNPGEIENIVELMLADLRVRLSERNITVQITEEAKRFIAREGYDPVYGARPLRRFIAKEVETQVARALLRDGAIEGSTVRVDVDGDRLVVTHEMVGAQA
jgi:ATP-dependent Clp protease ATP-binding subunit ClpB